MTERFLAFLDEGMLGFAVLAIALIVVLPMLPFIAIGFGFSRLAQGMAARSGETGTGSTEGNSPVAESDAPND